MSLERPQAPDPYDLLPPKPSFTLESDEVTDGELMDKSFVAPMAGGESDHSPHLRWSGFPEETKGFAVTCFDPDAPDPQRLLALAAGQPARPRRTELASGAGSGGELPEGAFHVRNDYGEKAWGGAAPPEGDPPHRYVFAVHALDVEKLDVNEDVSPAFVGFNLAFHTLARGGDPAAVQRVAAAAMTSTTVSVRERGRVDHEVIERGVACVAAVEVAHVGLARAVAVLAQALGVRRGRGPRAPSPARRAAPAGRRGARAARPGGRAGSRRRRGRG